MYKSIFNVLLLIAGLLLLTALPLAAQNTENIVLNANWSPNGEFVSYLAADGIHVMDKQGTNDRLLVPPTGFGGWTADSTGIFIIENRNPSEAVLEWWIYPINGTESFQFLPQLNSIRTLVYSNDSEQLAISAQENASDPYKIWVANADGSHLRPLAEYDAYDLSWSSDDKQVIVEILLEDSDNRQMVEVSIDVSGNDEPQIRPLVDGMRSIGDNIDFYYGTDASYPPATFYITDILDNRESVFTINQLVADIDYSEASRSIVFTAYCDPTDIDEAFFHGEWSASEQEAVESALYLIDTVTSEEHVLIPCGNGSQIAPTLSPDGQEILFIWINNHHWDVYRIIADEARFINIKES